MRFIASAMFSAIGLAFMGAALLAPGLSQDDSTARWFLFILGGVIVRLTLPDTTR
jgi:hypothetical protein